MSKIQLIKTRDELRTALSRVQAMLDTILEGERAVAREKAAARAAKRKTEPKVNPSHDPRVAAIREAVRLHAPGSQVFNNRRKDGSRMVKVWKLLHPATRGLLMDEIRATVPDAQFSTSSDLRYTKGDGRYLHVVIPPQK